MLDSESHETRDRVIHDERIRRGNYQAPPMFRYTFEKRRRRIVGIACLLYFGSITLILALSVPDLGFSMTSAEAILPSAKTIDLHEKTPGEFDRRIVVVLAYNEPMSLMVGKTFRQQVRITELQSAKILDRFVGPGKVIRKELLANARLRVRLIGNPEAFSILPISTEDQLLLDGGLSQWDWEVTPKQSGQRSLYIRVSLRLMDPVVGTETQDQMPILLPVHVDSNTAHSVTKFGAANWQYLLSALLLPLITWLGRRALSWWKTHRKAGPRADGIRGDDIPVDKTLWLPDTAKADLGQANGQRSKVEIGDH